MHFFGSKNSLIAEKIILVTERIIFVTERIILSSRIYLINVVHSIFWRVLALFVSWHKCSKWALTRVAFHQLNYSCCSVLSQEVFFTLSLLQDLTHGFCHVWINYLIIRDVSCYTKANKTTQNCSFDRTCGPEVNGVWILQGTCHHCNSWC